MPLLTAAPLGNPAPADPHGQLPVRPQPSVKLDMLRNPVLIRCRSLALHLLVGWNKGEGEVEMFTIMPGCFAPAILPCEKEGSGGGNGRHGLLDPLNPLGLVLCQPRDSPIRPLQHSPQNL